ncbi:MAG: lipoprotein insertase outer membrane protein LolB [Porticoccaceae bacterium]
MPRHFAPRATLLPWVARLAVLALALAIAGCATRLPAPETRAWTPHQQALLAMRHWQLEGKLGYRSPEQNGSALIRWTQNNDAFDLHLSGPFGAGATRISGDGQLAVLRQQGRDDIRAPSAGELTEWLFGWELPVAQMTAWVKGIPAPEPRAAQVTLNATGQLERLEQAGWQLQFDRFHPVGAQVLPGRIKGTRGDVAFTLVIKAWQPMDGTP